MYKIGDKVEYLNNVWEVCDCEIDSVEIYNEKMGVNIYVPIDDVKHYQSAHDKLLALGWEHSQLSEDLDDHYYELNDEYIWFSISEKNYRLSNGLEVSLELSRILTQYLEEL